MKKQILLQILILVSILTISAQEKPIAVLKEHKNEVLNLAFSPDGKYLITSAKDNSAIIWDLATYKPSVTLTGFVSTSVKALTYSADGNTIFASGDKSIRAYKTNGEFQYILSGNKTYMWMLSVNPQGTYLTGGSYDFSPRVWSLTEKKYITDLKGHQKNALVSRFSPNGGMIATGSLDYSVKLWDTIKWSCTATFKGHTNNVVDLAWTPDSKKLISASHDKTLKVWDIASGKCDRTIVGHTGAIICVAVSPDGKLIISAGLDKSIYLWELSTGKNLYVYDKHSATINALAFSPDGQYFASASSDKTALIWKYNPDIVVDLLYNEEVKADIKANPVFNPREKDEPKDLYKNRMNAADSTKRVIYDKYYKVFLSK